MTFFLLFLRCSGFFCADELKLIRSGSKSKRFVPVLDCKITFNTIDNLIWKPQRSRSGGWWSENHWTVFWFAVLLLFFMEIPRLCYYFFAYTFSEKAPAQDRSPYLVSILFRCTLRARVPVFFRAAIANSSSASAVCLWAVKGRSNKRLLGLAVPIHFYLSNKHFGATSRFIINQFWLLAQSFLAPSFSLIHF